MSSLQNRGKVLLLTVGISVYVKYTLKDKLPNHLGVCGVCITIGQDKPLDFSDVLIGLIQSACEFAVDAGVVVTNDEFQSAIKRAIRWADTLALTDRNKTP